LTFRCILVIYFHRTRDSRHQLSPTEVVHNSVEYCRSTLRPKGPFLLGLIIKTVFVMAITKDKKKAISEKLNNILDSAKSLVFVNFHGLGVVDEGNVRNALREANVGYYVAKKTLIKRALEAKGYKGEMPDLEGELALVSGEDLVAPAREINTFTKKLKDTLLIQGGVFEGRYMSASEMLDIANIPSEQTLYAQVVNIINSPIQGFVMALSEIAKKKEASV